MARYSTRITLQGRFSPCDLRSIEAELSEPAFRGIPVGPALSSLVEIDLYGGRGDWSLAARVKDLGRQLKYYFRPLCGRQAMPLLAKRRTLVTWLGENFRLSELILPVIRELDPDRCTVFCSQPAMMLRVPAGAEAVTPRMMPLDRTGWLTEYRKCRPHWNQRLQRLCRKYRLPRGAGNRLALHMMYATQNISGCLALLPLLEPLAVVTEFDRDPLSACLILAARSLGIPTYTLVHGVLNEEARGAVPLLAGKVFCWGEMQRTQFMAAGEDPAKIVIAGCPRLTRELSVTPAKAREKLALDRDNPVVMLGTNPCSWRDCLNMAELFCTAMAGMRGVSALVRLHPSERLEMYRPVARHHPGVRFLNNSDATLDETLAAADVVVVPNSGFGSDALVKRRPVVVLDLPTVPLGHGADLINRAGCPRATTADELAAAVRGLLPDGPQRQQHLARADRYVAEFCALFGQESAQCIAEHVRQTVSANRANWERQRI